MARTKSHKADEDLRGRVKELEKINKSLRKRLRQLEKNRHVWQQNQLDDEDPIEDIKPMEEHKCDHCEYGVLIFTDLGIKTLVSCSSCLYRKTHNRGEK